MVVHGLRCGDGQGRGGGFGSAVMVVSCAVSVINESSSVDDMSRGADFDCCRNGEWCLSACGSEGCETDVGEQVNLVRVFELVLVVAAVMVVEDGVRHSSDHADVNVGTPPFAVLLLFKRC